VTRSQLTKAQVTQKILQLEGVKRSWKRICEISSDLRPNSNLIWRGGLPGAAEQEGADLVAMAMLNNRTSALRSRTFGKRISL